MEAVARGGGDRERARTALAAVSLRANARGLRVKAVGRGVGGSGHPRPSNVEPIRVRRWEETNQSACRIGKARG